MEAVAGGGDISVIGHFGMGFYYGHLVSDTVRVASKAASTTSMSSTVHLGICCWWFLVITVQKDTEMPFAETKV